jgi:hypothetical protein
MAMLHTSGNRSIIERGWTYEALLLGLEYAVKLRHIGMVQNFHLWELKHRIEAYFFGYAGLYARPKGVPLLICRTSQNCDPSLLLSIFRSDKRQEFLQQILFWACRAL